MLKRIMAVAAVSGLALTSALAQTHDPAPAATDAADRGHSGRAGADRQRQPPARPARPTS